MAAYEYYRNSLPGWGTSQFQFGAPPVPTFQPQPSWTGLDFFNAHAYNPDPSLYQSVMGRLGSYSGIALDHRSAQQWHYMIYSGLTPLTQALPADVGGAAAYEIYRTWKYNASLYAPLSADRMMQREGLIGMSIAEATRLWQYTGRPMDVYGQRAACEAAAATAAHLADRFLSYAGTGGAAIFPPSAVPSPYAGVGGTPLPVTSSAYGTYPYAGSSSSAGYSPRLSSSQGAIAAPPGSTVVVTHPRHRSHSRHRHSGSHSDDGHHHHLRRRSSVEIIQTGGGGGGGRGRYGYVPYGAGYAAPGYATTGYAAPGYVAPGYVAPGYAPGYGGGYAPGYPSGCVLG
ncbi:hypothetical protein GSI_03582 [Ganoderma sinense ZZ0214-1]|uniref:Uncharacterized protein n=1 Tax=Ganoderma sinense ZZ0214-1 TaxID=1077348 RepID=A0A2G8SJC4_9APHY|nr:hypothetical protein GSI_03582 [Ganoderma sinense ZZ0214-1]